MITYNAFGYSTNGKMVLIHLDEPQMLYLRRIIKVYKEELCGCKQDIRECEKLLDIANKEIVSMEINERQLFNLLKTIEVYKNEMCCNRKSKRECKTLIKLINTQVGV